MNYLQIGAGIYPEWGIDILKHNQNAKVYFVEPHPADFLEMYKNIKKHCPQNSNYELICAAVGIENTISQFETTSSFAINDTAKTFTSVQNKYRSNRYNGDYAFYTGVISFNKLLDMIKPVKEISIDIEGHEVDLINNWDFKNKPDNLLIEIHNIEYIAHMNHILSNQGYTLDKVLENPNANGNPRNRHLYFSSI